MWLFSSFTFKGRLGMLTQYKIHKLPIRQYIMHTVMTCIPVSSHCIEPDMFGYTGAIELYYMKIHPYQQQKNVHFMFSRNI